MNEQKVQEAIDNIISKQQAKGWKSTKVTKKSIAKIEELGLTEFVPEWMLRYGEKSALYINAIIDASQAGSKSETHSSWSIEGDADVVTVKDDASELYKAMGDNRQCQAFSPGEYAPRKTSGRLVKPIARQPLNSPRIKKLESKMNKLRARFNDLRGEMMVNPTRALIDEAYELQAKIKDLNLQAFGMSPTDTVHSAEITRYEISDLLDFNGGS